MEFVGGYYMNLIDRDAIGMWFLPKFPDEKLDGTLIIDDKGECQLQVSHNFGGLQGIGGNGQVEAINGFMANGDKVTLFNCIQKQQEWAIPGFPVTVYTSAFAIIGEWFTNDEGVVVTEITASYDHLNYWLNTKPFVKEYDCESKEIRLIYKMPEIITCNTGNEVIELTYTAMLNCDSFNSFKIHQSEFVCFKFAAIIPYRVAINSVYSFAEFLTLCIGKRISVRSVTGKNKAGQTLEFIFLKDAVDDKVAKKREMYIEFSYIKDVFEDVMKNWQDKSEILKPIIDYFVEAHENGFRIPMSFLNIVQALEAYSRRMRNNEVMLPEVFENKIKSIIESIQNAEDQEWVKSILSNEPRLRQRLTELFEETNYVFDISLNKRKSWIHKIIDTRNYYTHFDNSLEDKILQQKEMYYLSELMKLVLRVLLMQELGLNQELIKHRMQENQELLHIKESLGLIPSTKPFDIKIISVGTEKSDSPDE